MGGKEIQIIGYVDNAIIIAEVKDNLQKLIDQFVETAVNIT